ncbi:MAG: hypothetical protein ACKOWK_06380 [Micrococcales bacterium]
MALKINPNHQLLWRDTNVLQIGVGAPAVVLQNLTAAEERFIDALYYGVPEQSLVPTASQLRVSPERSTELLKAVDGLLMTTPRVEPGDKDYSAVASSERARASLDNRSDHRLVLARRRAATVFIEQMDATGLTLLLALAAAGVGTVVSRDSGSVTREDAASNLYPIALVGRSRVPAARLILDSSWPGTKLLNYSKLGDRRTVPYSLAVITSTLVTNPASAASWRTSDTPVLEIRYQPYGAEVSPVLDGSDGCLVCRDHRAQDVDASHIAVSSQMHQTELRFDDGGTRLVACGLAVGSILEFIDTGSARTSHRYSRETDRVESAAGWGSHPACGCQVSAAVI